MPSSRASLLGARGPCRDFPDEAAGVGDGAVLSGDLGASSAGEPEPAEKHTTSGAQPLQSAVLALTTIVSELANAKRPSERGSKLEAAPDRAEGFAPSAEPSSSSGGSGRSKAAVERLLEEDLLHRRLGTNLQDARATSRAWLEHRSHLGHYPTTIRLMWYLTGVWDALREGRVAEARARCALAVAAGDQQSLDGGSWILAEQVGLEPPPPLQVFANRRGQHGEALILA